MGIQISGGQSEDGVIVGNVYDKYGSRNPIVHWIQRGYMNAIDDLVKKAAPKSIHEIGCGEGFWVLHWNQLGIASRGSDFSKQVIDLARENAVQKGLSTENFYVKSIYDINPEQDSADLVVCCEVLEHLERPNEALDALKKIVNNNLILSVPKEPLWHFLNMLRVKYLLKYGNTPGHIQQWSKSRFIQLVSRYFEIVEVKTPFPWTMVLCHAKK